MRTTASKSGLLLACGYFARDEAEWVDTTSPAADRGNMFHAAIAHYVDTGEAAVVDAYDVSALMASGAAWVDAFGRDKLAAEVAFAWDHVTDTAERIEVKGRDYSAGKGRLCGTADLVAVNRTTKRGLVFDWKTGDGSKSGPQLRTLALMLARAEGLDSVTVEALEVSADGVRHVCTETIVRFEDLRPGMPEKQRTFEAIASELAEALASVATAEPNPGSHCGEFYCPARAACPAGREVEALIPDASLVRHEWGVTIKSADHAAYLFERAKLVSKVADDVLEAVRKYVPAEGLSLSDGRTMAVSEGHARSSFNVAMAKSLLVAKGATEAEIEACSPSSLVRGSLRISGGAAKPRKERAA